MKKITKRTTTDTTTTGTAVVPADTTTNVTPSVPAPLTLTDIGIDAPNAPACIGPMVNAIRLIATMPANTRDERIACVAAYVDAMSAAMPGHADPVGRHTGRFTGMAVFETQNTIYVACVLANVTVQNGHVMATWRGELPNAKCDYIGRDYAWSTLSEYVGGHHNGAPGLPGAVDAVVAWSKRGRKPLAV